MTVHTHTQVVLRHKAHKWGTSLWTKAGFFVNSPGCCGESGSWWSLTARDVVTPGLLRSPWLSFTPLCPNLQTPPAAAVDSLISPIKFCNSFSNSSSSGCQPPQLLLCIFFIPLTKMSGLLSSCLAPEFKLTDVLISNGISALIMPVEILTQRYT